MNTNKRVAGILADAQIKLALLWLSLLLTYLLGDVLKIFRSNLKVGEIGGKKITNPLWIGIAILLAIPVMMIFLFMLEGYFWFQGSLSCDQGFSVIVQGDDSNFAECAVGTLDFNGYKETK